MTVQIDLNVRRSRFVALAVVAVDGWTYPLFAYLHDHWQGNENADPTYTLGKIESKPFRIGVIRSASHHWNTSPSPATVEFSLVNDSSKSFDPEDYLGNICRLYIGTDISQELNYSSDFFLIFFGRIKKISRNRESIDVSANDDYFLTINDEVNRHNVVTIDDFPDTPGSLVEYRSPTATGGIVGLIAPLCNDSDQFLANWDDNSGGSFWDSALPSNIVSGQTVVPVTAYSLSQVGGFNIVTITDPVYLPSSGEDVYYDLVNANVTLAWLAKIYNWYTWVGSQTSALVDVDDTDFSDYLGSIFSYAMQRDKISDFMDDVFKGIFYSVPADNPLTLRGKLSGGHATAHKKIQTNSSAYYRFDEGIDIVAFRKIEGQTDDAIKTIRINYAYDYSLEKYTESVTATKTTSINSSIVNETLFNFRHIKSGSSRYAQQLADMIISQYAYGIVLYELTCPMKGAVLNLHDVIFIKYSLVNYADNHGLFLIKEKSIDLNNGVTNLIVEDITRYVRGRIRLGNRGGAADTDYASADDFYKFTYCYLCDRSDNMFADDITPGKQFYY